VEQPCRALTPESTFEHPKDPLSPNHLLPLGERGRRRENTRESTMTTSVPQKRYLYWFKKNEFSACRDYLLEKGYTLTSTLLTPCQVLKSYGGNLIYAPPEVWSRICVRQGSWYRQSIKEGQYMLMSDHKLPDSLDKFVEVEMSSSDFLPENLPSQNELQEIVNSEAYQKNKPREWEDIGVKDAILFKLMFTLSRFWGKGDNLRKYWLSQRANHANFLSRKCTTKMEGEDVPYSVSENAGVCSSCAEIFNVVSETSRKLVRSCPGAVIFGGAERNIYYDIKPIQIRSIKDGKTPD
jgi:hypothetical protein